MSLRTFCLTLCISLAACSADDSSTPTPPATQGWVAPTPAPPALPAAVPAQDLHVLAVGGNGFRPEMGLAGLRQRFGDAEVVEAEVDMGEGQTEPGAVIHPNDPTRRAYVYFVDGDVSKPISAIYVREAASNWSGPFGLKLGMTASDLERINGKPFRFLGFGWDYGGYVSHWTDGALSRAFIPPGQLSVRLEPPAPADGANLPDGYPSGDGEFASDTAIVRENPPVLGEMGLSFITPGA